MTTIIYKTYKSAISHWWLILMAGMVLIGLGVWIIASPFQSFLSLSKIFAMGILATGIFEIVFALNNHKSIETWGWTLVSGLVDLFVGGYLFLNPLITMVVLPVIIGFWMLFRGVFAIGNSIDMRAYGFWDWRWLLASAIFVILLACLILGNLAFGVVNMIVWTGLAFICAGIFRIHFSLKLRKLKQNF